jgi:glucarate dehydratase
MPRIIHVAVTPVAFRDPPLLNNAGVHEPWCLRNIIELTIEGGMVGLGETYGDDGIRRCLDAAAPRLVGLDVTDHAAIERIAAEACGATRIGAQEQSTRTGADMLVPRVFGAFEVAATDALARHLGVPVAALLGGQVRETVPFAAYLFYKFERHRFDPTMPADPWGAALTPEGIVEQARRMVALHGFRSLKLKAGVFAPEAETEALLALRAAFPDAPLRIDPNGGWHVHTTLKLLPKLVPVLEYLEDPTSGITPMAAVQAQCPIPLATNMCVVAWAHLKPAIAQDAVRVILSDHHYWGGLRASRDLARICDTWGLGLSMHSNSHLGISLAAMAHLGAATPNLTYDCDTHYPWLEDDLIEGGKLPIVDGAVRVPPGPGLGVTLDRARLAAMHADWQRCGIRKRDDATEMRKYNPAFTGQRPGF